MPIIILHSTSFTEYLLAVRGLTASCVHVSVPVMICKGQGHWVAVVVICNDVMFPKSFASRTFSTGHMLSNKALYRLFPTTVVFFSSYAPARRMSRGMKLWC